jgi:hypothetical protein
MWALIKKSSPWAVAICAVAAMVIAVAVIKGGFELICNTSGCTLKPSAVSLAFPDERLREAVASSELVTQPLYFEFDRVTYTVLSIDETKQRIQYEAASSSSLKNAGATHVSYDLNFGMLDKVEEASLQIDRDERVPKTGSIGSRQRFDFGTVSVPPRTTIRLDYKVRVTAPFPLRDLDTLKLAAFNRVLTIRTPAQLDKDKMTARIFPIFKSKGFTYEPTRQVAGDYVEYKWVSPENSLLFPFQGFFVVIDAK